MAERALARGEHDLDAVESALRTVVMAAGAQALGEFMRVAAQRAAAQGVCCAKCNTPMRSSGMRAKNVLTMLGETPYTRARYVCPACGAVRYPGDEALDIADTSRSPGVRRQAARLGAKEPFRKVAEYLRELAGIALSRKDAERIAEAVGEDIERRDARARERTRFAPPPEAPKDLDTLYIEMDGTGVPMVPRELAGRKGKQPGGGANPGARREIDYLHRNRHHMRYAHYRAQGLYIGSGIIEAACKNLAAARLKQSGMEWTTRGANAIIALRCATLSNRFQDYWDQRAA